MALKADRQIDSVELRYFLNEVASAGKVLVVSTAGSGVAMDSIVNLATVSASSSGGKPLGMLINDFVSIDLTRQHVNYHKDEQVVGDKCTIVRKGWLVTDAITGTPAAGDHAVLSSSGTVTNLAPGGTWNEALNPKVGRFVTKKDESGYATVYIDL